MLFYNHKQEFIGIDEDGLKLLNYDSLEALLEVCSDVADLFAKEPGYIHNFKNFGWIDFLLHADSDASSAIVHANGRTFSCMLQVHKLYLCAEPSQNGYMIEMLHVVPMSGEEIKAGTPAAAPKPQAEPKPAAETVQPAAEPAPSTLPDYGYLTPTPLSEPGTLDIPTYEPVEFEPVPEPAEDLYAAPALDKEDVSIPQEEVFKETISIPHEEIFKEVQPSPEPVVAETLRKPEISAPISKGIHFTPEEQKFIDELKVDASYRFDPSIAANELGLPVDLIEEFIGDFIQQSHDFKDDLFDAVLRGDMNNLKILSHKLKGVAANLRIEDAFECLSIVNTSDDIVQIEANLKYFYGIVAKLEGKEPSFAINDTPTEEPAQPFRPAESPSPFKESAQPISLDDLETFPPVAEDDIYAFALKDETHTPAQAAEPEIPDYSLGLKQEEGSLIVQADELEMEKEETATPAVDVKPLHYDKQAIAAQLGIDSSFFDELIEDYRKDAQVAGEQIAHAIAAFDTLQWKKAAVQLKGISDNLRMNEISEELAVLIRTNDAQEAHKASKRLNGYLEQL